MVVFAGFINLSYHIKLSILKLSRFTPSSMIYIRLHQAGNEEIEDETSWMQAGLFKMQAGEDKKFR